MGCQDQSIHPERDWYSIIADCPQANLILADYKWKTNLSIESLKHNKNNEKHK